MTLVVSFAGKTPVSETGTGPAYAVWSYAVTPGTPDDIVIGQRIALALPSAIDIQNPQLYPSAATALAGMFVQQDAASSRQYVGRIVVVAGTQTLSFVAPDAPSTCEVWLLTRTTGPWETVAFAQSATDAPNIVQVLTGPAARIGPAVVPVTNGRAAADFSGTLPYASELFGVYQPLAGWLGRQAVDRARVDGATVPKRSTDPASVAMDRQSEVGSTYVSPSATFIAPVSGWLSPVGLINLFRQYFFEFDNFLGSPSGHVWISPGGTVEVIETSTRRTTIEKTAEQSEQTSRKVEEDLTSQDDIADAVKEENANDTKLGDQRHRRREHAGVPRRGQRQRQHRHVGQEVRRGHPQAVPDAELEGDQRDHPQLQDDVQDRDRHHRHDEPALRRPEHHRSARQLRAAAQDAQGRRPGAAHRHPAQLAGLPGRARPGPRASAI